MNQPTNLLIT